MRRLVILRPEPGSGATVEKARGMGLDARALPLFRIDPVAWEMPDLARFDALLLTSANAIRCGGEKLADLRGRPAYAVGEATAGAARDAGFDVAGVGHGDLQSLLAQVPKSLRLLHPCGEHRTDPGAAGHSITPLTVYRAEALPVPDAAGALRGCVAAVHSPRAATRIAELVDGSERATIGLAAISPAAAKAAGIGWNAVEFAQIPTDEALLALAARLCEEGAGK